MIFRSLRRLAAAAEARAATDMERLELERQWLKERARLLSIQTDALVDSAKSLERMSSEKEPPPAAEIP